MPIPSGTSIATTPAPNRPKRVYLRQRRPARRLTQAAASATSAPAGSNSTSGSNERPKYSRASSGLVATIVAMICAEVGWWYSAT